MCWLPSASLSTAPTSVGAPTAAIAASTSATVSGSLAAPGSSAPSPHTARSGGSAASSACSAICSRATASSSPHRGGRRRLPDVDLRSWRRRVGAVRDGERDQRRRQDQARGHAAAGPRACSLPRRRPTASTRSALTASTTKVTPHTPVDVARGRTTRSSTWETPSPPQLNPPSGQAVRTQSDDGPQRCQRRPPSAADGPGAGPPGRTDRTATAEPAQSSVIAIHAISPNRPIQ